MTAELVVPDLIEPLEGWRVWRAVPDGYDLELRSLYNDTAWQRGVAAEMRCPRRGDNTPCPPEACDERHQCGIHAAKTAELALSYLPVRLRRPAFEPIPVLPTTGLVYGRVHLWGEVEEAKLSFRGQYAYPAAIYVPVSFQAGGIDAHAAADMLASGYRVPVELVRHAADAVAA